MEGTISSTLASVPAWMQPTATPRLSDEERTVARDIFEGKVEGKSACHFCAGLHATVAGLAPSRQPCPRIKRVEWHADGTVLVVEYHHPGDWADENTIFPHDVYDE